MFASDNLVYKPTESIKAMITRLHVKCVTTG